MPLPPPSWVAAVAATFRHQLRMLLHSRLTLVFQLAFLIATPVAVFLVGDFFAAGEASIDLMLGFLPWIALVFTPALAMKTFAGRPLDREREFLLTLPLPVGAIAVGAWAAGSAALIATLAFTAPFAVTVAWLGAPDFGVMAAGYLGAALLLVSFYAVGLFASAAARSEIGAFALAVAILFLLLMLGWDGFGRLAPAGAGGGLENAAYASPKFWMERIASGRVEFRALLYFVGLTGLALVGAALALDARRGPGRAAVLGAGALAGGALLVALVAAVPSRLALDVTAARRFTLSEGTLDIVRRLPDGARIDLYRSAGSDAGTPAAIRAYAAEVRELLDLMADGSDGRLSVAIHDAEADAASGDAAEAAGVRRVPLSSGDAFYLGATISADGRRVAIPYLDQRREGLLEYDLATGLSGLSRTGARKIAIVTPLLAPGDPNAAETGLNAVAELRRAYDVAIVPPFADRLPDDLDAIVVMGATFLKREMLYSIDQAVMRGAGLIAMIDPRLRLSPSNDKATPQPSEEIDDLSDLLLRYGLRYLGAEVVGDAALATPVADGSQQTLAFPYWMRFGPSGISRTHAVSADLRDLLFVEPGAFAGPAEATLVETTAAAGALPVRDLAERTPAAATALFRPGGGARTIAAEVDGAFESAFPAPPGEASVVHLPRAAKPAAVFAVADVDWILDPFAYEPETEPGAPRRPRNDNVAFFLNMAERAAGGGELIAIRSRGEARRTLSRVEALARDLSDADREERAAALTRIAEVEKRIAELPAAAGVADLSQLPPEVRARVAEFRAALAPDRRTLREFDRREKSALERLRARVILFNLIGGPALALAFAGLAALTRRRSAHDL